MLKVQTVSGSLLAAAAALHLGGVALADDGNTPPIATNNDAAMEQGGSDQVQTIANENSRTVTGSKHKFEPELLLRQTMSVQTYNTPVGKFSTARSETRLEGRANLPGNVLLEGEGYYTTHDNFTVDYANNGQKTPNSEFVVRAQPHYILSIPVLRGQEPEKDERFEIDHLTLQKRIGNTNVTLGVLKPEMRMGVTSLIPANVIDYLPDQALLTPRMAALHVSYPVINADKFNMNVNVMAGTVLQRIVGPYDLGVLGGNIIVHSIRDVDPNNRSFSQPAETTDTGHAFGAMLNAKYQVTPFLSLLAASSVVQPNGATNYKPPHLRGSGMVMASYKREFDTVSFNMTGAIALGSYRRDYFGMVTAPSTITYALTSSIAKNGYMLSAEVASTKISNTGNVRSDGDVTAYEVTLTKEFGKNVNAGIFIMGRNTDLYAARVIEPRPYYPVSRQPDVFAAGLKIIMKSSMRDPSL